MLMNPQLLNLAHLHLRAQTSQLGGPSHHLPRVAVPKKHMEKKVRGSRAVCCCSTGVLCPLLRKPERKAMCMTALA